jgi:hypothetical protein
VTEVSVYNKNNRYWYTSRRDGLGNGNGTYHADLVASDSSDRYVGALLVIQPEEIIFSREPVDAAKGCTFGWSSRWHTAVA